jgi:peptidoglycan hydrolase-like protein with peptidoglycan-binding domain
MMDTLKFILFSIVVLVLVGILGYWAVATIKSGPEFASNQKIKELQNENEDLTKQVAELTDKLNTLQTQTVTPTPTTSSPSTSGATTAAATTTAPAKTTTYKNQSLINELQKLVAANITMKLNSSGTRVGTVQNFLNIYNNTINKIDNDYGASMVKAVAAFQKAQGLTANGQAGSSTFNKMISWLKKQG